MKHFDVKLFDVKLPHLCKPTQKRGEGQMCEFKGDGVITRYTELVSCIIYNLGCGSALILEEMNPFLPLLFMHILILLPDYVLICN